MLNNLLKKLDLDSNKNVIEIPISENNTKENKEEDKAYKKAEAKRLAKERAKINEFYNEWIKVMAYLKIKNELHETFALRDIVYEPYGFSCTVHAPTGMTTKRLDNQDTIDVIQNNLKCIFLMKHIPKSNFSEVKFITKDIPSVNFKPLKLSPYEIYMSTGLDGQPMTSNMVKYPHALIQGATGSGKTKFIDLILTNLIATESMSDISIYIAQADKADQIIYRKCEHCQGYADNLMQIFLMLRYLIDILEKRKELLKPYMEDGIAENIYEYNKAIDEGIIVGKPKWKYMYLVVDEYASLMPDGEYNKEQKQLKQAIQNIMERILQISRYAGLFAILSTQRATIDKMPSFVKGMCNTIVTFRVNNRKSSEVAIDSGDAVNLKQREFISKVEEVSYGRTVNLTQPAIHRWIKPFKLISPVCTNFESYNNLDELFGDKKKNKRKSKEDRRKTKEKKENVNISKVANDSALKKAEELIVKEEKEVTSVVEAQVLNPITPNNKTKVKSNLDIKPKSEFYIENWVDPSKDPNINIIDKTKIKNSDIDFVKK